MIRDISHRRVRNIFYKYVRGNKYPLKGIVFKRKISTLYNKYINETCFIIGNGPSLTAGDLTKIKNTGIVCFAANSIYKMYEDTEWRPTYHCFQDWQMIEGLTEQFSSFVNQTEGVFIRRDAYKLIPIEVAECSNTYMPKVVMHIRKDNMFDFSDDASAYISDGTTITYFIMQLAYYMGFRTFYLVGLDHNFPAYLDKNDNVVQNPDVKQHAFVDDRKVVINPARVLEATNAYKSARAFFEEHGVECLNATRGGKLEVFERIDLDSIFERCKVNE